MNSNLKECPYCAELIKTRAIKCHHCGQNLFDNQNTKTNSRSWDDPIAIICGVLALILYLTNPTQNDFKEAIVQRINESGTVEKSNAFQKLIVGIASYAIDSVTTRTNYYIFSIFEIDSSLLRIIDSDTPRLKFVGIAGRIIPLFQNDASSNTNKNSSHRDISEDKVSKKFKNEISSANQNDSDNIGSDEQESGGFQQDCRGVLKNDDEYGLILKNYQSNILWDTWCDAEIDDLSNKVLKVCSIDDRCEIRGRVTGHGAFHWNRIDQVTKLDPL